MDTVKTLKTEYNKVLEQWNKATEYLESKERAASEVDKWLPKYEDILKQRNALCMDIWRNRELNLWQKSLRTDLYSYPLTHTRSR